MGAAILRVATGVGHLHDFRPAPRTHQVAADVHHDRSTPAIASPASAARPAMSLFAKEFSAIGVWSNRVAVRAAGSRLQCACFISVTAAARSAGLGVRFSAAALFHTRTAASAEASSTGPRAPLVEQRQRLEQFRRYPFRAPRRRIPPAELARPVPCARLRIAASRPISRRAASSARSASAALRAPIFNSSDVPGAFLGDRRDETIALGAQVNCLWPTARAREAPIATPRGIFIIGIGDARPPAVTPRGRPSWRRRVKVCKIRQGITLAARLPPPVR